MVRCRFQQCQCLVLRKKHDLLPAARKMSLLRVTVQRATNLPDVDLRGKSDPYVKLLFQGKQRRSSLNLKAAKQGAGSLGYLLE